MASPTKQAIIDSFLHLAAKKSPDKITVRDIVDDCGINRNTFYYYFQDIYAVIEALCAELFEAVPKEQPLAPTLSAFYTHILTFATEHPAAARSLALSLGFEGMERFLAADTDGMITHAVATGGEKPLSPTALRFFRHALLGLSLDALRGGKHPVSGKEEANAFFCRLAQTLDLTERTPL